MTDPRISRQGHDLDHIEAIKRKHFVFGVVTFENKFQQIDRLCSSIYTACDIAGLTCDVVLLQNSADKIPQEVRKTHPVQIIEFEGNFGFGKGHNRIVEGLGSAAGMYVGLNPDGFLLPDAMKNALRWVTSDANLYEFAQFPQEHPKVFDPESGKTAWCSGAAFMICADQFRALGGFDDRFFMYCEDVDLSWRVKNSGAECIFMGDARFFHDVSDGRMTDEVIVRMLTSQVILARKWGSRLGGWRAMRQLRKVCRVSGIAMPNLPQRYGEDFDKPPVFCDFSRRGSYSKVRW